MSAGRHLEVGQRTSGSQPADIFLYKNIQYKNIQTNNTQKGSILLKKEHS